MVLDICNQLHRKEHRLDQPWGAESNLPISCDQFLVVHPIRQMLLAPQLSINLIAYLLLIMVFLPLQGLHLPLLPF